MMILNTLNNNSCSGDSLMHGKEMFGMVYTLYSSKHILFMY